jgi:cytochrome c oxidase subunit 4
MLGIAVTKAVLVILYFMDIRDASRLTRLVVVSGFVWFALMVLFTMSDVLTRT